MSIITYYFLLLNINKNIPTILFLYNIAKLWQRYKIGRTSKTSSSITFHPVGIYEYICVAYSRSRNFVLFDIKLQSCASSQIDTVIKNKHSLKNINALF